MLMRLLFRQTKYRSFTEVGHKLIHGVTHEAGHWHADLFRGARQF